MNNRHLEIDFVIHVMNFHLLECTVKTTLIVPSDTEFLGYVLCRRAVGVDHEQWLEWFLSGHRALLLLSLEPTG